MRQVSAFIDTQILERLRLHGVTFATDALVVALAYALAEEVRFNGHVPLWYVRSYFAILPLIVLSYLVFLYLYGIHRRLWQYAGARDMRSIIEASMLASAIVLIVDLLVSGSRPLPVFVVPAGATFALFGFVIIRIWRRLRRPHFAVDDSWARVLIVGAGHAGQAVASDLLNNAGWREYPVAFLDDDRRKLRMRIHGIRVVGTIEALPDVVRQLDIDVVGVAIPSATRPQLDRILAYAQETDARIQILPSRAEILQSGGAMRLRDVNLDDLVRQAGEGQGAPLAVREHIRDRVVVVTGAAGSIGSELCRQLLGLQPRLLVAIDNNESGLFYLQKELGQDEHSSALSTVLGDITDAEKMHRLFRSFRPHAVFHAAAYKHVPMLENFPEEAVFVNVMGTLNVCEAALEVRCRHVVFVSTDKAVHPVNALGFSKRIGELLVRAHANAETACCCVRFGNVIGSRGSALPEFMRQIDAGGPVTVTDPNVERYFMTISEAVRLVIEAGTRAAGGELFMLDMGQPIKLDQLARQMIRARGLRVGKDIEVVYTGLRPGEKLSEELIFEHERCSSTDNPSILCVEDSTCPALSQLRPQLDTLLRAARSGDRAAVLVLLSQIAQTLRDEPSVAS